MSTDSFYAEHRGGAGRVWLVIAMTPDGDEHAIFGSIEAARAWVAANVSADVGCVYVPYVVDEPDFGNVPAAELQ